MIVILVRLPNLEQLSCRKYSQKHYLCKHIMKGEKLQITEERFLLSAMQHGDLKAYGVLFRRYYPILCAYATKFVELKDAEEIVQDVCCGYGKTGKRKLSRHL